MSAEREPQPVPSRPDMPGYGVPSEGELLPFSWAEQRLRDARNYWLATARADRQPHLAVVWGIWLDDQLLFSTGRRSCKARNLAVEARCAIAPDAGDGPESVVLEGVVTEVTDPSVKARFDEEVLAKYDFDTGSMDEPIYAIHPAKVIGLDADFNLRATRWTFPRE